MTQNERDYIIDRLFAIRGAYTVQERPPQSAAWNDLIEFVKRLETSD